MSRVVMSRVVMSRVFTLVLLGTCLLSAGACAQKKEAPVKQEAVAAEAPEPEAEAPKPEAEVKAPWQLPPPPVPRNVNPTRVPVPEDFIPNAEQRIGKSANLITELDRLDAEIRKSGG